jgi:cysteine desulfuration protein SufE
MDEPTPDNSLAARRRELLAPLAALRDPQARLAWLVERARHRPLLCKDLRTEGHRVQGCMVRCWWVPEFREGRCWFRIDSDAVSLKAVIGLLCDFYSDASPEEVLANPPTFLQRLGLMRQLAENRRATVGRVADAIREFARQYAADAPAPATNRDAVRLHRPT